MPAEARITREKILDAALDLVRERGHAALTARALAARLGCSTQPLLYQFASLDELRRAACERADAFHTAYITALPEGCGDPLLAIGLRYIRFAAEEPRLFRFLFQADGFAGQSLEDLIADPQVAFLIDQTRASTGLGADRAAALFKALFVAVHGYASLLANNAMRWDPAEAEALLSGLGEALASHMKEEEQ